MVMTSHPTGLPMKAEQVFFADPAIDRLLAMIMTLAAEVHVTRDRLACLEFLLESGQPVTREALDRFQPTPEQAERLDAARRALSSELMFCTLGIEASLGAPEEGVDRFDKS
ncbi:hypothetical protein EDC22_104347 [Tepidamorphus gemmatus]|jgi:hypothetical protein|uniref:Uncharacterized protein n=1 Tax=Tepidamorphus gemmatus TaxID=747076 RepID=A0A4R3MCY2_9HYPH|nr:hypothetical protein [Tepidamorphus gemmatus]TCT11584.1 hypothetical protein EDC22_104347 [Tepidamorphus gemmatus]